MDYDSIVGIYLKSKIRCQKPVKVKRCMYNYHERIKKLNQILCPLGNNGLNSVYYAET